MTEARPTAKLYDTDGSFLADLPLAAGIQWQDESSAAGALSLRLPLDDPTTAQATSRRLLKVFWRGQARQVARIDSSSTDVAVDGRMWREWSNLPGLLSILGAAPVYPEYGLDRTSNTARTFGYMSRYGHGIWLDSGDFGPAVGVDWSAMTGAKYGMPAGLDFPNPQWIAKRGPTHNEPANSYQYFRRIFPTDARMKVQILATADNFLDLWLDGEQIVSSDGQNPFTWRDAFQVSMTLEPSPVGGRHTIAARVRNQKGDPSPVGFIFTMQEVDNDGNVKEQPPIINSKADDHWIVSDIAPGFRKAEVLNRLWSEANLYGYAATALIGEGYTITQDSDGNAWDDDPAEYTFDVGQSVLDVLAAFTEKDVDVAIDPTTLKLQMWNRRGADKTSTVQLNLGRDGGGLISHRVERAEPTFNTILMQLADGRWMQRHSAASVSLHGREATGLSVGSTSDAKSAYAVADAQLLDGAQPAITFTTQVSSLTGPQPYIDFDIGDTIAVPNENGDGYYAARVMAVTVDASSDGPVQVTPELVLDRSATPPDFDADGPGEDDPGDLAEPGDPTPPSDPGDPTPDSTPSPISGGGTDVAYDWTANPYGSTYDATGGSGGYIPDDTHSGVPSGSTFAQTVTATGGTLTIGTAATAKGTGAAAASTNKITLVGHGMPNGQPIYFSALSSDGAGLSTGVGNWGVVANATSNTFQVKRLNEDTGAFATVNITADYSTVTVMAGVWYDQVDFACYITVASSATGLLLFTRCRHRGPATASATSPSAAQGMIFNLSSAYVIGADVEAIPDAPVAKLDAFYGKNYRLFRAKWKHVIDGIGSQGNNVAYGAYATDAAWFYPDPEHSDGTHCDLGMQVFGNDKHRMIGCHVEGLVAASVSSTSDPSGHPIPTVTNTVLQVNHSGGLNAPTGVLWDRVLLGGGAYTINVDGKEDRPNVGRVNGRFKRNARYGAITAPAPGAKAGGATIHFDTSGCVYDDNGAAITPGSGIYVGPGADGAASHLVWP